MKFHRTLMVTAVSALIGGMTAAPSVFAIGGTVSGLIPPLPALPAAPPLLEDLPGFALPDGAIPNFVLQLPLPELPLPHLPSVPLPLNAEENTIASCGGGADLTVGSLVTLRNLLPNNQVEVYARSEDGSVCRAGVYNTGGVSDTCGIVCSGQNAIIADGGYVFATNPGSADTPVIGDGSVSVFRIEKDTLALVDVESTHGPNPRSVTRHGDLVYVVNGGVYQGLLGPAISVVPQSIQGYRFDAATGNLTALAGSYARTIDAAGDAAQIQFTGDGQHLVLANRRTTNALTSGAEPDTIEVVTLNAGGTPARIQAHDVGGDTPFGFRMVDNRVYLSMGGPTQSPNLGGSGVFAIDAQGGMTTLTPFTADHGTDTCWNVISRTTTQPYFYTSAFFDSAVGKWQIQADGSMVLINPEEASSAASGQFNYLADEGGLDMAITENGSAEYVYVLNNPVPPPVGLPVVRMVGYRVHANGDLEQLNNAVASGLVNSGFGLWAL